MTDFRELFGRRWFKILIALVILGLLMLIFSKFFINTLGSVVAKIVGAVVVGIGLLFGRLKKT